MVQCYVVGCLGQTGCQLLQRMTSQSTVVHTTSAVGIVPLLQQRVNGCACTYRCALDVAGAAASSGAGTAQCVGHALETARSVHHTVQCTMCLQPNEPPCGS